MLPFPFKNKPKKKQWNYQLDAVYSVGILDFIFDDHKDEKEFLHIVELKNQRGEVFYDKLKSVIYRTPKIPKEGRRIDHTF